MSWDAVIVCVRGPFRPIAEVSAGDYLPLGNLRAATAAVCAAFPDAEWDTSTCARYLLDKYTAIIIELNHVETSNSIHISVSGPGNPVPSLLSLANANGWLIVDCSSSEFIDPERTESRGFDGYKQMWLDLQDRHRNREGRDSPPPRS